VLVNTSLAFNCFRGNGWHFYFLYGDIIYIIKFMMQKYSVNQSDPTNDNL